MINAKNILFFLCLLTVSIISVFFILLKSNMVPVEMGGADSAVFATMGFSWLNGCIPYRDLFDHKGPILYLLNLLGFLIFDDFYGVVVIQAYLMCISFIIFLLYDKNNIISITILIIFIFKFVIIPNFEGGNFTEEYSTVFNAIAGLAFLRRMPSRFIIYGVMGAILFHIRPNLAAPALSFCIIDIINTHQQRYREILKLFASFIVPNVIIVLYFYLNSGLNYFIDSYFVFNIKYSTQCSGNFFSAIYYFTTNNIKSLFAIPLVLPTLYLNKKLFFSILFITIFSLVFGTISGRIYDHYFLIMITPLFMVYTLIIKYYNTDILILNIIKRCFSLIGFKIRDQKVTCVLLFSIICLDIYIVYTYLPRTIGRLDMSACNSIRSKLSTYGLDEHSKILNLSDHYSSRFFYILKSPPIEKDFFPRTARITDKFSYVLNNKILFCPNNYDMVIVDKDQQLDKSCKYTEIDQLYKQVRIYIKNK